MEKEKNYKVVGKEINTHCVANIEAKWNTNLFPTQQPDRLLTFTSRKILTFLVVDQVITLVAVHLFP